MSHDVDPTWFESAESSGKKKKEQKQKKQKKKKKNANCDDLVEFENPAATVVELWNTAEWYWEEDTKQLSSHNPNMVLPGTNFVQYSQSVTNELEEAYQLFKLKGKSAAKLTVDLENRIASTGTEQKAANKESGTLFHVDFGTMTQNNARTEFKRKIHRQEESPNATV